MSSLRFAALLSAGALAVLALGIAAYAVQVTTGHDSMLGFLRLFDVGNEQSLPTYVSTVYLLVASALLFLLYRSEQHLDSGNHRYWLFLSLLFLLLSVDESISIHENFALVYTFLVSRELILPTMDSHEWLPFGVLFVVVVAVISLPFLRRLPRDTARWMLISAAVFLSGAIGFEFLGAVMLKAQIVDSKFDWLYLLRRIFEEGLEIFGVVIFNWTLYRELQRHAQIKHTTQIS
jgi:hypothetical protein